MFDDHKNEEPGWREYWQSGGDTKELEKASKNQGKRKINKKIILIFFILGLCCVMIFAIKSQLSSNQRFSQKNLTNWTDKDLYRNVTGTKVVSSQIEDYLENMKSYTNSLSSICNNMKNNRKNNYTKLDNEEYTNYFACYLYMIDVPLEMESYQEKIKNSINTVNNFVPDPETYIMIKDFNKLINAINDQKFTSIIAEFLEEYGYYYQYDPENGYLEWKIKKDYPY